MNLKTNPELLPVIEWWEKDGKTTVIWCLVAALAVGGWYGYKGYRAQRLAAASDSVATAFTAEEIETAVNKFSGLPVEGVQRVRLAKRYFDDGRYEEALAVYNGLAADTPDGLQGIPAVGKAQCLEALGKYADAQRAFDEFVASSNDRHYLYLTAQLGSARCLAQQEKKADALKAIAALKDAKKDDQIATARIEQTEELIKRWEKQVAKVEPKVEPKAEAKVETKAEAKTEAKK